MIYIMWFYYDNKPKRTRDDILHFYPMQLYLQDVTMWNLCGWPLLAIALGYISNNVELARSSQFEWSHLQRMISDCVQLFLPLLEAFNDVHYWMVQFLSMKYNCLLSPLGLVAWVFWSCGDCFLGILFSCESPSILVNTIAV